MSTRRRSLESKGSLGRARALFVSCFSLLIGAFAGCANGLEIRFVELSQARLDSDMLSLIVDDYALDRFDHRAGGHQYVLNFDLATPDNAPRHVSCSQFAGGKDRSGYFMIGPCGDTVMQIRELGLTVIDSKVYPIAALRMLSRDSKTGQWGERRKWERMPFFADPDLTRLLVREPDAVRAYQLPGGERLQLSDAGELWRSIGSSWELAPEMPPTDGDDSPPDFTGLTSDCDYASADGGVVFAKFIYERGRRSWRKLPNSIDLPSVGRVWVKEVRRNGDQWEFRCLKDGPTQALGMVVVTEDLKEVRGAISPSIDVRSIADSVGKWWSPRERVMLAWDVNENAIETGKFTLRLWRYSNPNDAQRVITITIDVQKILDLPAAQVARPRPH